MNVNVLLLFLSAAVQRLFRGNFEILRLIYDSNPHIQEKNTICGVFFIFYGLSVDLVSRT